MDRRGDPVGASLQNNQDYHIFQRLIEHDLLKKTSYQHDV
jgi:hypothetical protein